MQQTDLTNYVVLNDSMTTTRGMYSTRELNFAMRYEYIINLIKNKNRTVIPSIGLAGYPYFRKLKHMPYTGPFESSIASLGAMVKIVPRLNCNISRRIFIDFNIPIAIVDLNTSFEKIEYPPIRMADNRYVITKAKMMPAYISARLGVGVNL